MGSFIVKPGQSLFDCVLMCGGTLEVAVQLALANDVAVDAALVPGTVLMVPDSVVVDKGVVAFLTARKIVVGTAL